MHTEHICTVSPLQLTLPKRHLSPGQARWWIQVGGWYACEHFCVCLCVRMSGIRSEICRRAVCTILFARICLFLFHTIPDMGLVSFVSPCGYFMFFTVLSSSVFYTVQRFAAEMQSAVSGFMLGPYQSMWLTVGQGLRPYLSILGDKQTHCISNIRNALVQSIDTRDTVQPQTV